jgi:hypothetical protein
VREHPQTGPLLRRTRLLAVHGATLGRHELTVKGLFGSSVAAQSGCICRHCE